MSQSADPSCPAGPAQGWIPSLADPAELRHALEQAFDYRGDVMLTLNDGRSIEGYVFDRRADGPGLDDCQVRVFPKDGSPKISIRYSQITRLEFTGRDTAAGKGFQQWLQRYHERKAAGEKDIRLEPEKLD